MLTDLAYLAVTFIGGAALGYWFLPVFFRHNPSLAPSAIEAHLKASALNFGANGLPIVEANAKALIATVKTEASKLGVTIP